MDVRTGRTAAALAAVALTGALAAGCTPTTDEGAPTPSFTSPSPSPSPTQTYAVPDTIEGEIARAVYTPDGGTDDSPMVETIASDAVAADMLFTVRGQCVGDGVDYSLITANVGDSGRELLSGTLVCGVEDDLPAQSSVYEGLVQVMLGSTDDVDAAWVAVVPAS
jgi:hypothetical protein